MANKIWEGHERREHDEECKERARALKEWVADKIRIATKPTKSRQAVMWTILVLMLGSSGLMTVKNVSIANEASDIHGQQRAMDTQQTADIRHNAEQLAEIVTAHKDLVDSTEDTSKMVHSIREQQIEVQTNQKNIIKILERIEKKINL